MEIGKRYDVVYTTGRYEIEYENGVKCIKKTPKSYRVERVDGTTRLIGQDSIMELKEVVGHTTPKELDAAKKACVRPEPGPLPDHVYAYTASIRKRLEGRGITLLGYVRSMRSGKSNFRCSNGHEWRTTPMHVGEGQGCPECGIGERDPEEIRQRIKAGVICLLTHPDKPGFVKIGLGYGTLEEVCREWPWGDWEMHRYRNVEEVALAESLIWKLLGEPLPHDREPIKKDLNVAEDAFRKLIYAMREEIALAEKAKEVSHKTD